MSQKLSVVVQVDLEGTYCRLVVSGCLTAVNQQGLYPLIRRARALPTGGRVIVDLTSAPLVDSSALELLREAIDNDDLARHTGPVQFLTPDVVLADPAPLPTRTARRTRRSPRPTAPRTALATVATGEEVA